MDKLDEKKCECGCNHDHCDENCDCSNEPLILEMEDINGEKVKVQVIGTVNDLDNEDNSYIFEVQTTEQGDMLVSIDDEKEFDRLCKVVEKLISENN